jgi:hypothetical protein
MSIELKGKASDVEQKQNAGKVFITILGFGSLLSERSSRTTFSNFRTFVWAESRTIGESLVIQQQSNSYVYTGRWLNATVQKIFRRATC